MSIEVPEDSGVPIAAVEQATGIARATLRIWERRYGFPEPLRDDRGERSYPREQVERLRLIGGLVARGHRPGRLVALSASQLRALAGPAAGAVPGAAQRAGGGADAPTLAWLRKHDGAGLAMHLESAIRTAGLAGFVTSRMPALNQAVGAAWARGEIQVFEEHLYTETIERLLHQAIAALPAPGPQARPRVLLATFAEEPHGLGLLMAQALIALQGCPCTSLGVRMPVGQIVAAATAMQPDVVGLSFTAAVNPAHVLRGLEQLRGELPSQMAVWAGGSHPLLARRRLVGVQAVPEIGGVGELVARWRESHAPAGFS